ncbi:hypothetical protein [Kineococcus sp. SYSU DK002]|uniref:hypothetical protein n=1 Tax=Kineococcus sp. SYSU DK002 TaxID=3383123 RepID=UPI003D7CE2FA
MVRLNDDVPAQPEGDAVDEDWITGWAEADGVRVPLPRGWAPVGPDAGVPVVGAQVALHATPVASDADGTPFAPTIVVTFVDAHPDASAAAFGAQALAAAVEVCGAATGDGRVLGYEVWLPPAQPDRVDAGRRLSFAHRREAATLAVTQVVRVVDRPAGRGVLTVTATVPALHRLTHAADVDRVAAAVEVRADRPAGPPAATPPAPPTVAVTPTVEVEDVRALVPRQPFTTAGPRVARAAFEEFLRRRKVGPRRAGHADLLAAGLVDADGRPTPDGTAVRELLRTRSAHLRLESARGPVPLSLDVSHRGGRALVVATAGPADVPVPGGAVAAPEVLGEATRVRLDWVDASHLPVVLAAWSGLEPRWVAAATAAPSEEDLLRRVDDPDAPHPPDADEGLRRAWAGDWYLWTMRLAGQPVGRVVVRAGDGGSWLLTGASGLGEPAARQWVPAALAQDLDRFTLALVLA